LKTIEVLETTNNSIAVFTDGSCNPVFGTGGWAAILFVDGKKIVLSGSQSETTHQCMELTAAIKAIEHVETLSPVDPVISIYTDSQYLVNLPERKEKLLASGLATKKNLPVRNADLIHQLLGYLDTLPVRLIKVKAHEKSSGIRNCNREVDKLSRKIVRDSVRNSSHKHR
jgi:ribonuclease HI